MSLIFKIKETRRLLFCVGIAAFFATGGCGSQHLNPPKPIPAAPPYYVLDEPKVLSREALEALESILIEHDRLTGQQFLIGIFKSLEHQNLDEQTHRIFQNWKVGKRGEDNGILLVIFVAEQKAKIETGIGLASIMTDSLSKEIAAGIHIPSRSHSDDNSFAEKIYQILDTLGSPLIQSGKADQFLRYGGLIHTRSEIEDELGGAASSTPALQNAWIVLLLFGLGILTFILYRILSREAHFTHSGWYRPPFWQFRFSRRNRFRNTDSLGGASGSW